MILAYLALPYGQAAMHAMLAQAATPQGANAPDPAKFAILGVIFAPIGLLIGLLISTVLLWVLVSLVGGEAKFATLLSIVTYAGATSILLGIAGVAGLMLQGVGAVPSPAGLQPALGLDLLVPDAGRLLPALLKGLDPLPIWGVILNAIRTHTVLKTPKRTGYAGCRPRRRVRPARPRAARWERGTASTTRSPSPRGDRTSPTRARRRAPRRCRS